MTTTTGYSSPLTFTAPDGSTITGTLTIDVPDTAPIPTPTPEPVPVPVPTPDRVRNVWHQGWRGPTITTWPGDVLDNITSITVDMCQSAKAGTGKLTDPPGITRDQVQAVTETHPALTVWAGIGGSGAGGLLLTQSSHVTDMVDSVHRIVDRYGLRGVVLDLEGAPGSDWTISAVLDLAEELAASGIGVAACSALYGGRREAWGTVAKVLGSHLAWWERMFYDFPKARDHRLTDVVTSSTDGIPAMLPYLGSPRQAVATFMPTDPGDVNSSPLDVIGAAYAGALSVSSSTGWSIFHDRNDSTNEWAATRALIRRA